jgi:hypothetical protein
MAKKKLRIWLSATSVLGEDSGQIFPILEKKYDIIQSQQLVIEADNKFNLEAHLKELEKCDLFLGIIQPKLSKSVTGVDNIYLEEIKKAIELNIPYWYLVHRDVTFSRSLLNDLVKTNDGGIKSKNKYFFDIRTIDIYKAILSQSADNEGNNQPSEFFRLNNLISSFDKTIFNISNQGNTKLMIASTVYGFEDQLSKIISDITEKDFIVLNSFYGSIKVNPKLSNLDICLIGVEDANSFMGIVRPYYGTGNIKEKNITFEEIKFAIHLKKPRWFFIHRDVIFGAKILGSIQVNKIDDENSVISNELVQNHFIDRGAIDLYNYVIKDNEKKLELRNGNWAQEFFYFTEALIYIRSQFLDSEFIENLLNTNTDGR